MGILTDEIRRIIYILDEERQRQNLQGKGLENKHYYVIGRSLGSIFY